MSQLFDLKSVRNNPTRSGFDLSQVLNFSAAPGQILPIMCREAMPGEKFKMNVKNLTRTQPLQKAAFARCKEYFDFFFVPTRLLWKYFPNMIIRNPRSDSSIKNLEGEVSSQTPVVVPSFNLKDVVNGLRGSDYLDYNSQIECCKLLQMLGYGDISPLVKDPARETDWLGHGHLVTLPKVLAYQKVYQDFFRNSQWEEYDATAFNVDYLNNLGENLDSNRLDIDFDISSINNFNIFQMRFANYKKDIVFGLRPNTQFGDVSVVSTTTSQYVVPGTGDEVHDLTWYPTDTDTYVPAAVSSSPSFPQMMAQLKGEFDILSLRRAEALQKLNEITIANDFRYNSQIYARFGFKVPDSRAQLTEYLGGHSNILNITDVDATAAGSVEGQEGTYTSALGMVSGKGTMGSQDDTDIDYEVKEHGYILGLYHILPYVTYDATMIDRENEHFVFEDFLNPELSNLGLEGVTAGNTLDIGMFNNDVAPSRVIGYAPRYWEYKTAQDKCFDEFMTGGNLHDYVIPLGVRQSDIAELGLNFKNMKVLRSGMNSIFYFDASPTTPPFLLNVFLDVRAIRPLSVDGMPY